MLADYLIFYACGPVRFTPLDDQHPRNCNKPTILKLFPDQSERRPLHTRDLETGCWDY